MPDIEPIDLSTRSFIITKCVDKIFLLSSSEIVDSNGTDIILTLEHLCEYYIINKSFIPLWLRLQNKLLNL